MKLTEEQLVAEIVRLRGVVEESAVALEMIAEAWRHLRLDTPEDQELHERVLGVTDEAVQALRGAL